MTNENRGPELVRDDELTKELRAAYAAPADAAYWATLEERIMARIDAGVWWSVPERWLRVGLVAAGIAVIIAGSLLLRTQSQVSRMAYDVAIDSAATDNLEVARRDRLTEEQETLRRLTGRK
jgi:predicted hotdog family 3-hydroxylacyl-ACP dehydratase